MILDATCSFGRIWPRHATIRIDIRPEVKPDIVMDARQTNFPNAYFDEIYCDPPHLIAGRELDLTKINNARRLSGRYKSSSMMERYGYWKFRDDWLDFVKDTNIEFARILKPNGILHYKITDGATKKGNTGGATHLTELVSLMDNFKVVNDAITNSGSKMKKSNPTKVHWLTMKIKREVIA